MEIMLKYLFDNDFKIKKKKVVILKIKHLRAGLKTCPKSKGIEQGLGKPLWGCLLCLSW